MKLPTTEIALLIGFCGCGSAPVSVESEPGAEPVLVNAETGQATTLADAMSRLRLAKVVFVGEEHGNPQDHLLQRDVYAALVGDGRRVGLGLEMFQTPFQQHLDRYAASQITEEELLTETEWETRWGGDFRDYRPAMELARAHGAPIFALNAPKEVTRAAARQGLDGLPEELRAQVPELDLTSTAHRDLVLGALRQHGGMSEPRLERLYTAQVIWDETMAQSIAQAFERDPELDAMVVLAGRMHIERGLGIPLRAERRGVTPFVTFVPTNEVEPNEQRGHYLFVRPSVE